MKYLLRGTLNKRDAPELYALGKEAATGAGKARLTRLLGGRAWSYVENENPYAQIPRREDVSRSSGL